MGVEWEKIRRLSFQRSRVVHFTSHTRTRAIYQNPPLFFSFGCYCSGAEAAMSLSFVVTSRLCLQSFPGPLPLPFFLFYAQFLPFPTRCHSPSLTISSITSTACELRVTRVTTSTSTGLEKPTLFVKYNDIGDIDLQDETSTFGHSVCALAQRDRLVVSHTYP